MTEQPSTDPLPLLSDHLAGHVAATGAGVVAVHGRHGPPLAVLSGVVAPSSPPKKPWKQMRISRSPFRMGGASGRRWRGAIRRRTWRCSGSPTAKISPHSRRVRAAISGQATWYSLSDEGPKA